MRQSPLFIGRKGGYDEQGYIEPQRSAALPSLHITSARSPCRITASGLRFTIEELYSNRL